MTMVAAFADEQRRLLGESGNKAATQPAVD